MKKEIENQWELESCSLKKLYHFKILKSRKHFNSEYIQIVQNSVTKGYTVKNVFPPLSSSHQVPSPEGKWQYQFLVRLGKVVMCKQDRYIYIYTMCLCISVCRAGYQEGLARILRHELKLQATSRISSSGKP